MEIICCASQFPVMDTFTLTSKYNTAEEIKRKNNPSRIKKILFPQKTDQEYFYDQTDQRYLQGLV